ncbi:MAG: hypothetical protein ABH873_08720 [Candidatus Firestonebacteria bacterium]
MNKKKAQKMFKAALTYCEKNHKSELECARNINPDTFKNLTVKEFLEEYCWVVYTSNFKVKTIEALFPRLQKAFLNFDLAALAQMRSLTAVLTVFKNKIKANCFFKGSKAIAAEGFSTFKRRLEKQGINILEELPGIGPITKCLLARNIGLADVEKRDIWLKRASKACNASVSEFVTFLSKHNKEKRGVVDVVIWRYGAEKKFGL